MALVLSVKLKEDFYVGDEQYVLWLMEFPNKATVRQRSTGKTFKISDDMSTEIAPDVFVSSGDQWEPDTDTARLAFEAPKTILILRGDKYRNPPEHIRRKMK